jgi:mRNA interferase MazF
MQYQILVAPFPFGDLKSQKSRPVLCLTEPVGKYQELVLAYITTKISSPLLASDVLLNKDSKDFAQTKLVHNSVIRLHKLVTLPKEMLLGELGDLSPELVKEVKRKVLDLLITK